MASAPQGRVVPPALARLFPDLPADREELKFEFEGLAKTLAELALNPENGTPFAVVVRGGWGRGKTTLLRRARRLLDEPEWVDPGLPTRRAETLWFNAWKYPSEETVLAGLLGALLEKLQTGDLLSQLKEAILKYRGGATVAVLRMAAPGPLKELFDVEDKFAPVHEKRAFYDTFRLLFSQVSHVLFNGVGALRDLGGLSEEELWDEKAQRKATLAVFLDDLDRCPQKRVVEVLEAINLFLDLPGVCFYLGVDWQRLVGALPEAVRDEGEEFLEKIVQVAFDLPEVSEKDAGAYILELIADTPLAAVLRPGEGDQPGDVAVLAGALKRRHPRHVKRFLNDLSMGLAVLRNTGKLGSGESRLPEAAVVAWHLLSEVLPAERWREIRALPANMHVFLKEWEALGGEAEGGEEAEIPERLSQLRSSGLLERHFRVLRDLDDDQVHALHLASPPETPTQRRPPRGSIDLLDPESDAWVELPAGEFSMGSDEGRPNERPVHAVRLSAFRISRDPVTNADYAAYVRETGKRAPDPWNGGGIPKGKKNHPVTHVSWTDAEAFCVWLSKKLEAAKKLDATGGGGAVHLPTEAQWEYAACGSGGRIYPWGDGEPTEDRANFGRKVGDTTLVGSYARGATPEGIHDLAGNVWEWCRDGIRVYSDEPQADPIGPSKGSARVLRGGSWRNVPGNLRGACRNDDHPEHRLVHVGFRVVWSSSGGRS